MIKRVLWYSEAIHVHISTAVWCQIEDFRSQYRNFQSLQTHRSRHMFALSRQSLFKENFILFYLFAFLVSFFYFSRCHFFHQFRKLFSSRTCLLRGSPEVSNMHDDVNAYGRKGGLEPVSGSSELGKFGAPLKFDSSNKTIMSIPRVVNLRL